MQPRFLANPDAIPVSFAPHAASSSINPKGASSSSSTSSSSPPRTRA